MKSSSCLEKAGEKKEELGLDGALEKESAHSIGRHPAREWLLSRWAIWETQLPAAIACTQQSPVKVLAGTWKVHRSEQTELK